MQEASGDRADSFGSNTLTDNSSVGAATGKISGNAADFVRASTDNLSIADNPSLSFGAEDFSFGFWIYVNSTANPQYVINKWAASGSREYHILLVSGMKLRMLVSYDGGSYTTLNHTTTLSTGTWYWVYAYHQNGVELGISINNAAATTIAHTTGGFDGSSPFEVGMRSSGNYLDARLQQLAVWRAVKSADDRTSIYNGGSGLAHSSWDAGGGPALHFLTIHRRSENSLIGR